MALLHLPDATGRGLGIDVSVLALAVSALSLALVLLDAPEGPSARLTKMFYGLFVTMVVVQGVHVVEHIIQLNQVYVFGVASDNAMGLLGYVFSFQGTAEWLHLVFNSLYLVALYTIALPLAWLTPRTVPKWAFGAFVVGALGVETWHVIEHIVIISNVIQNGGCPCPGIGDRVLGVTDIQLHFAYNAVAYTGTLIPFWFVFRARRRSPLTFAVPTNQAHPLPQPQRRKRPV